MSLLEDAIDVAAPAATIPAKIATWLGAQHWGSTAFGFGIMLAVSWVQIDGLYLRPHIGPVGITLVDIKGWKPRALAAEKALAEVKAAQPKAAAAQAAVNHQPAAASAAIAKASDNDAQAYYAKGRAAGAAYAVAHPAGGLCAAPDQRVTGGADLSGADRAAGLDDRSGDAAAGVAVPRAQYDQLVANSLRLAKVHQDAESLIAAGVAVADTTGGK